MYTQRLLFAALAALSVSALPLNINLGAYSPALVVGDGEISFGGSPERASEVLQTLSTGAQNGAVPAGQAAPAASGGGEAATRPGEATPSAAAATPSSTPSTKPEGISSPLVSAASVDDGDAVPNVNVAPGLSGDANQLPAEYISHAIASNRYPNMAKAKRYVVVEDAPAVAEPEKMVRKSKRESTALAEKVKRDIDGFRAALQYARDAQLTQPRVELAFGITQNAGVNVPANSAANGVLPNGQPRPPVKREALPEPEAEVRREATPEPETDEKLGMTLIAISEI
ncbi:uncharacterized protein PV09_04806 [Verruconis gallopava]|uniref:Uncharacterized protein n=1 Tax=Verruconis gallopava TaxID=253628 RepID=A0A0D1YTK2_9PEZI|nr:uncharacterized protein PV09_04806 [Verruconis gallopava]KIW03972.1 hypothetical protein PV09_04806 [Verruconis gallopava]